jgi:hypothetical protein
MVRFSISALTRSGVMLWFGLISGLGLDFGLVLRLELILQLRLGLGYIRLSLGLG